MAAKELTEQIKSKTGGICKKINSNLYTVATHLSACSDVLARAKRREQAVR